jgi:hypothetical protein
MDKRGVFIIVLAAAAASLSGCAAVKRGHQRDVDFARFVRWLPGRYDNSAQAKSDLEKGVRPPHDAVELVVIPLESVAVGQSAFYVQETAADNALRVLSQRVFVFTETEKGFVEQINALTEPMRWRDGQHEPDMFQGMTKRDLKPAVGCELLWNPVEKPVVKGAKKLSKEEAEKASQVTRFVGKSDPKHCETTSHAVMGLVQVEYRGELSANEFFMAELQYDPDGKLILGSKDEPFYRFRRIGN